MKHIAYYNYDDALEKQISADQAMLLTLAGYIPHADRQNGTDHMFYPIPEDEKVFWESLVEETA